MNKYFNKKVVVDGEVFDSKKEYHHWCVLKLMERGGEISDLRRQVKFTLIPEQYRIEKTALKSGKIKEKKKVVERECSYVADFVYVDNKSGCVVVADTKGIQTKEFIIKRKLMLYMHGIEIKILK